MQLTYGATNAFDALVYGEKHPATVDYLRGQITQAADLFSGAGKAFYEKALQTFEHFNSNAAINFARNALQKFSGSSTDIQRVLYLGGINQLQGATVLMQRWLMANPQTRERYLDQRLDGYSDTYVNIHNLDIGKTHYDYRRVMDGLMVINDDGDATFTQYFDDLIEGDRDLTLGEKTAIVNSWDAANIFLAMGLDPTDPQGGEL